MGFGKKKNCLIKRASCHFFNFAHIFGVPFVDTVLGFVDGESKRRKGEEKEKGKKEGEGFSLELHFGSKRKKGEKEMEKGKEKAKQKNKDAVSRVFGVGCQVNLGGRNANLPPKLKKKKEKRGV